MVDVSFNISPPTCSHCSLEWQSIALANYTAQTVHSSKYAIDFLDQETMEIRKVLLQNHMALDMPTAAKGGTCALTHADSCAYIPDHHPNISLALTQMTNQISTLQQLGTDPLSTLFQSFLLPWQGLC